MRWTNGNTVSQLVLYIIRFFIFSETRVFLDLLRRPRNVKDVRKSYKFKTDKSEQRATNSCSLSLTRPLTKGNGKWSIYVSGAAAVTNGGGGEVI